MRKHKGISFCLRLLFWLPVMATVSLSPLFHTRRRLVAHAHHRPALVWALVYPENITDVKTALLCIHSYSLYLSLSLHLSVYSFSTSEFDK